MSAAPSAATPARAPGSARAATAVPTLHDVATAAGVSLATASRVLNGSTRRVADAYRERVEAAAAALGYSANLSAQATARGTAAVVALLVADIADSYFGQLAAGVARGADAAGLIVTIATTERDPGRELKLVRTLRGQRPRGLILAASRGAEADHADLLPEIDAITATGAHVVTLGSGLPGTRALGFDNRGGAHALGRRIAGLGYRDAVIIAGSPGLRTSEDRIAGFGEGFAAGGGTTPWVRHGAISRDAGYDLASDLLRGDGVPRGTVLFGISDVVAFGIMSAVRDAGLTPGVDIAVAGFDDIAAGRDIVPGLTTARLPLEALGQLALDAAVTPEWTPPELLPAEIIVRASTPQR